MSKVMVKSKPEEDRLYFYCGGKCRRDANNKILQNMITHNNRIKKGEANNLR